MPEISHSPRRRSAEEPLRIALIGVTGFAKNHFNAINRLVEKGEAQWAAVTIINPNAAEEQCRFLQNKGVPVYADYRAMLDTHREEIDWVCIPTGIGWHQPMTVAALERGMHVLVEKPLAPTLQEVAAIQRAEEQSGIRIAVGFQHIYLPQTWEIKKRLLEGEIGRVERIDCLALWPRAQSYYDRNDWAGRLRTSTSWILDSPLHNALSHVANLAMFWSGDSLEETGKPIRVSAELYRAKPIESFDTIRTVTQMESGVETAIVFSHSSEASIEPEVHITGTRGRLVWRYSGEHTLTIQDQTTEMTTPEQEYLRDNMFDSLTEHVRGRPARICSSGIARGVCQWVNAVHDTAPIKEVPESSRRRISGDGDDHLDVIQGMDEVAVRAFQKRCSFADSGAVWAGQVYERDVRTYTQFEGGGE